MKQYDKIYVHCHSMQSNLEIVLEPGECGKSVKRVDNVLVMTIEELREMAIAMVKEWVEETSDGSSIEEETTKDLHNYLTSKRN